MDAIGTDKFHRLYGREKTRIAYQANDFTDYVFMMVICVVIALGVYGRNNPLAWLCLCLCALEVITFGIRHGVSLRVPALVKRPQDVLYMLMYKVQNLRAMFYFAVLFLLLENYLIYLTPKWPHQVALMRTIAWSLFYSHFVLLSAYRTAILVSHLRGGSRVREFLMQTTWKGMLTRQPYISLEIWHAYFTGLLAHILLIAPWFFVISHANFSVLIFPAAGVINIITHKKFLRILNAWFYRDHWLCHHSELEFIYLHGPHHDAIPSGLIGVSGNGHLEGFLRHTLGAPGPFFNPVITFAVYGFELKGDIDGHQFIPGVYPNMPLAFQRINQHSMHHFARLEPYGFGLWLDQPGVSQGMRDGLKLLPDEIKNSIHLDEQLTDFKWDNPRHRSFLELYEKFEKE